MKVVYIDTEVEYNTFLQQIQNKDIIVHYIASDLHKHSAINEMTLLACYIQEDDRIYILLFDHNESLYKLGISDAIDNILNVVNILLVHDKKYFLQLINIYNSIKIIDLNLLYYFNTTEAIELNKFVDNPVYKEYKNLFGKITPASKLIEYCQTCITTLKDKYIGLDIDQIKTSAFLYYNDMMIPNLCEIEKNGIFVDATEFNTYFKDKQSLISKENLVYSQYHLYTSTGRPSNNYGGINYAALEKSDGSRKCFKSRFDNGYLLEFDFEGYHLKLIAKLMNFDIPDNISVHEYLGRYYFDTDKLTSEQYKESKDLSFKIIYGGHSKDFHEIPYFKRVDEYINELWLKFKENGFIITPISSKKMKKTPDLINKNKFFNYLIQLLETEYSMSVIKDLLHLIKVTNQKSKLILYTYDSFLFDCNSDDVNFIDLLKVQLKKYGLGYKLKNGNNYQELKLIS